MPPNAVAAPRMANSTPKLLPADSVSVPVTRASSNVSAGTDDSTIAPCEAVVYCIAALMHQGNSPKYKTPSAAIGATSRRATSKP